MREVTDKAFYVLNIFILAEIRLMWAYPSNGGLWDLNRSTS